MSPLNVENRRERNLIAFQVQGFETHPSLCTSLNSLEDIWSRPHENVPAML